MQSSSSSSAHSAQSIDASPTQVNVLPLSQPGFTQQARQAAASTVETALSPAALSPAPTSAPVPARASSGPSSEWYGSESEESDVEGEDEHVVTTRKPAKTTKPAKHTTPPRRSPPPVNEELEAQASRASKNAAHRANHTPLSSSAKGSSTTSDPSDPSDPATPPLATDASTATSVSLSSTTENTENTENTEDADPSANNTYFRIARVLLVVIVILLLLYLVYWVIANVFQVDVGAWFGWGSSVDGTDGAGGEGEAMNTTLDISEGGIDSSGVDSGVDNSGIDMDVSDSVSGNAMESYAPSPSPSPSTSTITSTTPEAGLGSMLSAPAFSTTPVPSPPLASSELSPPVGQVTARGAYGNVQMQQGLSERSAEALLDLMSRME